jgi:hypothetical protein
MKLILNDKDQIIFKTSIKDNKTILKRIERFALNVYVENYIDNLLNSFETYDSNYILKSFIEEIKEIEIHNSFSIDLWGNNEINISGDNGLINLQIVDLEEILAIH